MKTVEYLIEIWDDDTTIRGHVVSTDDAEFDRKCEDAVLADLEAGNDWAWCTVRVTARIGGVECSDYLGGCSYKSKADFEASDEYLAMKESALSDLRAEIEGRLYAILCAERAIAAEWAAHNACTETWTCTGCAYSVHIDPSERDIIGTPYCADCDQEMGREDDA